MVLQIVIWSGRDSFLTLFCALRLLGCRHWSSARGRTVHLLSVWLGRVHPEATHSAKEVISQMQQFHSGLTSEIWEGTVSVCSNCWHITWYPCIKSGLTSLPIKKPTCCLCYYTNDLFSLFHTLQKALLQRKLSMWTSLYLITTYVGWVWLWEEGKEILVVELTVPFEPNIEHAQNRKTEKYTPLISDLNQTGYHAKLVTLEIGARGYIPKQSKTKLMSVIKKSKTIPSLN